MSVSPGEYEFENRNALAEALARAIGRNLAESLARGGQASLVVSGGKTPAEMFRRLSRLNLGWASVCLTLADERWVPPDHAESNEGLLRSLLLTGQVASSRFVALKNAAETPEAGQPACDTALSALPVPLDVVVLGMGEDGHTASLFPGAPELPALLQPSGGARCHAVNPGGGARPRMSLTLPFLLNARRIYLHIEGEGKQAVYRRALDQGPIEDMPVRAVLHQSRTPVEVYWAP